MRIRPGITMQREFSLLDGQLRQRPMQPVRREPALVQIGNRRFTARVEIAAQPTTTEQQHSTAEFVRGWAKRQNHECAATLAGEFCGHLV